MTTFTPRLGTQYLHSFWTVCAFGLLAMLGSVLIVGGARSANQPSGLIAFARADGVYVMRSDGSGVRAIRRGVGGRWLVWAPDGRKLAFSTPAHGNVVWVMDADGSDLARLSTRGGQVESPTWSPDGRTIAYTALRDQNRDIWLMNADGSNQRRLARTPLWEYEVDWSPTGNRIAFTDIDESNVFVMNMNGSNRRKLTSGWGLHDLSWSPDGRRIAFKRNVTPEPGPWFNRNTEIYVTNASGGSSVRLTRNTIPDLSPAWSPDGNRLAFVRSNARNTNYARHEIYVMNTDGTGVTRLTHNQVGEASPAWQPAAAS